MNIKVLYHSMSGNTKKLAQAIAGAMNVQAEQITETTQVDDPVDLLFLGDGIYAGKANKHTLALMTKLTPETAKHVAVFATCGGQLGIGNDLQTLLSQRGLDVVGKPFVCKGQSWLLFNRGRPNQEDLKGARDFATQIKQQVTQEA